MQIQVHANHTVNTSASLEAWARQALTEGLERFRGEISSLEVHLADINGERRSEDHKRCLLEARLLGRSPLAVRHQAERLDEALQGACDKLRRALDRELGKQQDQRQARDTIRRGAGPDLA